MIAHRALHRTSPTNRETRTKLTRARFKEYNRILQSVRNAFNENQRCIEGKLRRGKTVLHLYE